MQARLATPRPLDALCRLDQSPLWGQREEGMSVVVLLLAIVAGFRSF